MSAVTNPAPDPQTRALVLGGGGARAAYEVGVLSAIADRVPNLEFPILTGVSAGAINATYLAAHRGSFAEAVRALRARWLELVADRVYRIRPLRLLAQWPAGPPPEGLRPINLLVLRPSRNLGALARGTGPKLPPLLRWAVRMMGGEQAAGADFLSYLVFDPVYTNTLIELGYADAQAGWERIERFLEATAPARAARPRPAGPA